MPLSVYRTKDLTQEKLQNLISSKASFILDDVKEVEAKVETCTKVIENQKMTCRRCVRGAILAPLLIVVPVIFVFLFDLLYKKSIMSSDDIIFISVIGILSLAYFGSKTFDYMKNKDADYKIIKNSDKIEVIHKENKE